MRWSVVDIVAATEATVQGPGDADIQGLSIDSRTLRPGDLFVAVKGQRDGHDFVGAAVQAGAAAVLVERPGRPVPVRPDGAPVPVLLVGSTSEALLRVGSAARDRLRVPVVAITGSVGKTSTKDLTAAALSAGRRTVASEKSFNNELGVPLTLANAPETAEVVVLEMGARGPGHIALLCRVARPSVGVVTAVAAAHTEMFGDLEGVARAKGELIEALPADGTAVLNGDDALVRGMATRGPARAILYSGARPPAAGTDVTAEDVRLDDELRASFRLRSPWGSAGVRLEARGAHQVGNALAALAVAGNEGVDLEAAATALRSAVLSPWRMELRRSRSGAAVLNDAYNANPASMAAALEALHAIPARRRVAVLGLMAELGDRRVEEHRAVAGLASRLGISLIAVGTPDYGVPPVRHAADAADAVGPLDGSVAVLVKGSRVAGLEEVAARLLDG